MINPNELRRGNYIMILSKPDPVRIPTGNILKVTEINWDTVSETNPKEVVNTEYPYSFVDPIPITQLWLKELGYEKTGKKVSNRIMLPGGGNNGFDGAEEFLKKDTHDTILNDNDKFYLIIDQNNDDYGANYTSKEILYVHQLQNLYFALTQTELRIKS